jgi:hypothetical protein
VIDHHHSYGLLMDSFESVTANAVKKASWLLRALFQTAPAPLSRDRALFTVILRSAKVVCLVTAREFDP